MAADLAHPLTASLLGGGFVAAFLHAALPTHWLPFVLVGRAQRWRMGQTLMAATLAGIAHVASTAVVGGAIVMAGLALNQWVAGLLPYLSAVLLFGFGGFYLVKAMVRRPALAGAAGRLDAPEPKVSNAAAIGGLVMMMALSPGEVLLPLYLSEADAGWPTLLALTGVFAAGTVLGMLLLTGAAWAGASILKLERWARYEGAVLGLALIALGLLVVTGTH